jgi:hypothetical protein
LTGTAIAALIVASIACAGAVAGLVAPSLKKASYTPYSPRVVREAFLDSGYSVATIGGNDGPIFVCQGLHGQRGSFVTVLRSVQYAKLVWVEIRPDFERKHEPARLVRNVIVAADAVGNKTTGFPTVLDSVIAKFSKPSVGVARSACLSLSSARSEKVRGRSRHSRRDPTLDRALTVAR